MIIKYKKTFFAVMVSVLILGGTFSAHGSGPGHWPILGELVGWGFEDPGDMVGSSGCGFWGARDTDSNRFYAPDDSGWTGLHGLTNFILCMEIYISPVVSPPVYNEDIRFCIQIADVGVPGNPRCTPWAIDGGGWSDPACDDIVAGGNDQPCFQPDQAQIGIEVRPLPPDKKIADAQAGLQLSTNRCSGPWGSAKYTPWASGGGGWTPAAYVEAVGRTDRFAWDVDCARIYLGAKVEDIPPPPLAVSCSADPSSIIAGQSVRWSAFPSGGRGAYDYSWSDSDRRTFSSREVSSWLVTYDSEGTKNASVIVSSTDGQTANASCGSITVSPSSSPLTQNPRGAHDSSSCEMSTGWACDPDDFGKALNVDFYANGPFGGGGTFIGSAAADIPRERGVADQCGGNPVHGFSFPTPDSLKDGVAHTIYAYGINIGAGTENPLLGGSPKEITCTLPPSLPCDTFFKPNILHGCYFDGIRAPTTASSVLAQSDDATIPSPVGNWDMGEIDWGAGVVNSTGKSDNVSAVWRAKVNFKEGTYVFHTVSDDGVELTVDGFGAVISNLTDHAAIQDDSATIPIPAGQRDITLRWYENGGQARIHLWWDFTPAPLAVTLAASPASRAQSSRSFNVRWNVTGGIPTTLDWVGMYKVGEADNHNFMQWFYTGGGMSGDLLFDSSHPPGNYEFRYLPNDGYLDIARSGPVRIFSLSSSPCDTSFKPDILHVCYFDGISAPLAKLNKPSILQSFISRIFVASQDAIAQFDDVTVPSPAGTWGGFDHNFGSGVVVAGRSDSVSGVWRGKINFDEGDYIFHVISDDGVELTVDGYGTVISNWTDHAAIQDDSATIPIPAGQRDITLRWYENGGDARIKFSWDKVSSPPPSTGTVKIRATVDGADYVLDGSPGRENLFIDVYLDGILVVPNLETSTIDYPGQLAGSYRLERVSGGPANKTYVGVQPSASTQLNPPGELTFTFNFTTASTPPPKFREIPPK